MDELRTRIKEAATDFGGANKLADTLGIPRRTLGGYLAGPYEPKASTLAGIARHTGINLEWLITGEGEKKKINADSRADITNLKTRPDFVLVPRLDVEASAGFGATAAREEVIDYISFQLAWFKRLGMSEKTARALKVRGDSMEPTLMHNDVVLVDTSIDRIIDNSIYVIGYDDTVLVKRVSLGLDGHLTLISDNPLYPPQEITPDRVPNLRICGRVKWFGRTI